MSEFYSQLPENFQAYSNWLIAVNKSGMIRIWDIRTGKFLYTFKLQEKCVNFCTNGAAFITLQTNDPRHILLKSYNFAHTNYHPHKPQKANKCILM